MNRDDRKAALQSYRDRAPQAGIYAVHAAGQCWIGASPTLDKIENRLRFTLAQGGHPNPALQSAAAGGLRVEVIEALDPATDPLSVPRLLKERLAHWRQQTGAHPL